jgi:hypothetical protein
MYWEQSLADQVWSFVSRFIGQKLLLLLSTVWEKPQQAFNIGIEQY